MSTADLAAIMAAVASRVKAATDLQRCYGWPVGSIVPPAFVVGYPDTIDLDLTMRRGSDRLTVKAWAVFGAVTEESTRNLASSFLQAIKDALDGAEPGVWATARASTISLESVYQEDGAEFLGARFDIDIAT